MTHPDHLSAAEGEPDVARRVHLLIDPPLDGRTIRVWALMGLVAFWVGVALVVR